MITTTLTGPEYDCRRYLVSDDGDADRMIPITWAELAKVNEADTMDEIATLAIGEKTILGMCDPIERLADEEGGTEASLYRCLAGDVVHLIVVGAQGVAGQHGCGATVAEAQASLERTPIGSERGERAVLEWALREDREELAGVEYVGDVRLR